MEKKKLGSIRDDDKQLSSSLGDVTQRVCSDLENKWKAESIGDFSGHAEITTRNCTSRDVGSVVTPKQLIDYSIRNTPGLCRPSKQSVDHLSSGGDVQHNLNNRIWFTARLLVFDTSDIIQEEKQSKYASDMDWTNSISSFALRSFIGIGFPSDSTWALYEDHKTGVSSKPLPFLRRSMYHCVWGSRCGQTYLPEVDLFPGAILFVRYSDEYKAPTPLRKFLHYTGNVLRILITGVDRSAKRKAIESEFSRQKVPEDQWFSVIAKLHVARLLVRPRHLMQLFKLQCLWRQDLRKRSSPVEAYLNLGLHYRNAMKDIKQYIKSQENRQNNTTASATNNISKQNELVMDQKSVRKILENGLIWFRLSEVDKQENMDLLWEALEAYSGFNGIPHFTDYISLVFGELPEVHRTLVRKVFLKMDPNRFGHIKLLDIKRFYNAPKWAVYQLGSDIAHSQLDLLSIFERTTNTPNRLEYTEFENYYQAVSIALGECPLDRLKSDATYVDLFSLLPSSECAQNYFMDQEADDGCDTFKQLIQDAWCM
ncbi:unnamed protein product [Heterobilharzia americana]|nr:unnamed protein product [Heterobilharzia americana]